METPAIAGNRALCPLRGLWRVSSWWHCPPMRFFGRVQVLTGGVMLWVLLFAEAGGGWWLLAVSGCFLYGCVGFFVGFHRYLAHRGSESPRWAIAMFHMLGVMACIGAAVGRVVTHCRLHATGDDSRNNHYADPGRAPFHPWMDAGNAVIRVAHICRYRRVPVFAAIFVAFFAVTGQAGVKNCDGIGCWDKNKFSELVVGEFFSSERKYVQRRMRDINITILGGINQGIIEDIKKITTLLSKRIPYNIFVEENKYENSNTAIIFVDNVPEFFLKDETRDILMKHGMDTNKLKLNKHIWCQFFEFIRQWEITGSLIVISKLRSFRDIGICATVGLFRAVGILRNLKENPAGMVDKNADLRSDVFGDMKSSPTSATRLENRLI